MGHDEIAAFRAQIEAADTIEKLREIQAELDASSCSSARVFKMHAAARIARLRATNNGNALRTVVAPAKVAVVSVSSASTPRYGVSTVDGRPLYGYHLTDQSFAQLQSDLVQWIVAGALTRDRGAALFVLWAADWFRRSYKGSGLAWDDVLAPLGVAVAYTDLRTATEKGLRAWGRPLRTNGLGRDFLGSLLREGGFPVAAVAEGGGGWARNLLRGLVAPLLADPNAHEAAAEVLARRACSAHSSQRFRDDDFAGVCADLALAVVRLRRETETRARASGLPLAAWLALNRPDWRSELPLVVSGAGADALIGNLLDVEASAAVRGTIAVERFLVRRAGETWHESARLGLDGAMHAAELGAIDPAEGRLRLFAHGELVRQLPRELGLVDPPMEGERHWECRSSQAARGLHPIGFNVAIALDLRVGDRAVAMIMLPGGQPRRGRLLVLERDLLVTDREALRVLGSGSGRYVAENVVVQLPAGWSIAVDDGGTLEDLGGGVVGAQLWSLVGIARIQDAEGDRYRVATGQDQDSRDRLHVDGRSASQLTSTSDVELFCGAPTISSLQGRAGKRFFRVLGERLWHPLGGALLPGQYEVALRDDDLLLDKRRIAVLPDAAQLQVIGRGDRAQWRLSGWGTVQLVPDPAAPLRVEADAWYARPTRAPVTVFDAVIIWPNGSRIGVRVPFPQEATLAFWEGHALAPGSKFTLADLEKIVGRDEGRMELVADLFDGSGLRQACLSWHFDKELPLAAIADDLADLLLPTHIDASVRLDMHNGINDNWYLRAFGNALEVTWKGLEATPAITDPDARLVGRALGEPEKEEDFGPCSLEASTNHRPITLPEQIAGDWLLYVRSGDRVLTRPLYVSQGPGHAAPTKVGQAMTMPRNELDATIAALLDSAAVDDAEGAAIIAELNTLTASLAGLPPMVFEVLKALAKRPEVLARMALAAGPEQRNAVLGIARGLPFAWYLIPKAVWDRAGGAMLTKLLEMLAGLDRSQMFAMEQVGQLTRALIEHEPLLRTLLDDGKSVGLRRDINQAFLQRAHQRLDSRAGGSRWRGRPELSLPSDHLALPDIALEVLDTPYSAALAARGRWLPGADDVRHIKLVARRFPNFFTDAFGAAFTETK